MKYLIRREIMIYFFFFIYKVKILLYPNLSIYICVKLSPINLNLGSCPPHPTNT